MLPFRHPKGWTPNELQPGAPDAVGCPRFSAFLTRHPEGRTPNSQNQLFHTHGDGPFIEVASGDLVEGNGLGNSYGMRWMDADDDGHLDLMGQTEVGPQLSPNDSGVKSWLEVTCFGTVLHHRQVIPPQSRPAHLRATLATNPQKLTIVLDNDLRFTD